MNFNEMFSKKELKEFMKDMSKHQRELFIELLENNEKNEEMNLNDYLFEFDTEFINNALKLECDEYLNWCMEENRRNGYIKNIEIQVGDRTINFNRPRLRNEKEFDSCIIPKRTKVMDDLKNNILILYSKNNSINEIKEILQEMFKLNVSVGFISAVVQRITESVLEWRMRELQKCYFTINIDCTYITIRDNKNLTTHKIPVYVAIGTDLYGYKEVLGIYLGNEDENKNIIEEVYDKDIGESKTFWLTVFNDLKDRGVEKVLFVISDGLAGIEEAIKDEFVTAKYQRCIVHIVRNVMKYTLNKDTKEVVKDFKKIYTSSTKEEAIMYYETFLKKYQSKKTLIKHVESYIDYILPIYNVPENIRKYIYTNNIVESANSKIKRGFYGRGALPNCQSAINIIYMSVKDLEKKWKKHKVQNWEEISNELYTLYYKEIKDYL